MAKRKWLRFVDSKTKEGIFSDDVRVLGTSGIMKMGDTGYVHLEPGATHMVIWDDAPPEVGVTQFYIDQPIPTITEHEAPREENLGAAMEAHRIIHGDRAKQYGRVRENFGRWSVLCKSVNINVDPYDLAILMALGKLARQANNYKRDNLVDAIGYLDIAQQLLDMDKDTK